MSDEELVSAPPAAKATVPMLPLMIAVILAVVFATAGTAAVLIWASRAGMLPMGGAKAPEKAVPNELPKTKLIALDPLLVNLSDPDGHSYLRVALTLKVEVEPEKSGKPKEEKAEKGPPKNEFEAAERDAALSILGRETGADLLAPDGKERLKRDLKSSLGERVPEVKVVDVLITEFLVQR